MKKVRCLRYRSALLAAALFLVVLSSCTTVKEYQKNKLNDNEMALARWRKQK